MSTLVSTQKFTMLNTYRNCCCKGVAYDAIVERVVSVENKFKNTIRTLVSHLRPFSEEKIDPRNESLKAMMIQIVSEGFSAFDTTWNAISNAIHIGHHLHHWKSIPK